MKYIEWDNTLLDDYLKDKMKRRGVESFEYEFLSRHIRKLKPEVIIDVGTFLGVSGYILGTSSPNLQKLYAIENIDDISFVPYGYEGSDIPKGDYGKFLPECGILKTHGYHNDLLPLLKENENKRVFVFLDAKKSSEGVLHELSTCHQGKAKYVGMHDTSMWYKRPRRAMKRAISLGWYNLIDEKYVKNIDSKSKGVSILELVE